MTGSTPWAVIEPCEPTHRYEILRAADAQRRAFADEVVMLGGVHRVHTELAHRAGWPTVFVRPTETAVPLCVAVGMVWEWRNRPRLGEGVHPFHPIARGDQPRDAALIIVERARGVRSVTVAAAR